jgi:hypothetical protein
MAKAAERVIPIEDTPQFADAVASQQGLSRRAPGRTRLPTAGTIAFALVTLVRDDQSNRFAAKNYKVQ